MKTPVTLIITLNAVTLLASCSSNSKPRWKSPGYSAFNQESEWRALQKDIEKADYEYYFYDDYTLRNSGNGIAPLDGIRIPSGESSNITSRDSTGFVVVQLYMLAQLDRVQQKVDSINRFFFARGADRVLITGLRGSGTSVYSDKNKAQQAVASDH